MIRIELIILVSAFAMGFLFFQPNILWKAVYSHYIFSNKYSWLTLVSIAILIWLVVSSLFPLNSDGKEKRKRRKSLILACSFLLFLHIVVSALPSVVALVPSAQYQSQ